ncbi:hypothetical protein DSECCO2_450120 [anaerobic digester metagenome]
MTLSTRVLNDVTSAIGTARSRTADLFTVFCTKSAMGFFSCTTLGGCACCLHFPGNMTDDHKVGAGGYQSDFIGKAGLGFDSGI